MMALALRALPAASAPVTVRGDSSGRFDAAPVRRHLSLETRPVPGAAQAKPTGLVGLDRGLQTKDLQDIPGEAIAQAFS